MTGRRRSARSRVAWLTAVALSVAVRAAAHPTALTSVTIVVDPASADVTIATDAAALRAKLDAMRRTLTECLELRADGIRVPLVERPRANDSAALLLQARLPAGISQLTWRSSIVYGSYPVVFQRAGDDRDNAQWLEGTEISAPFALDAPMPPRRGRRAAQAVTLGFTHILPNGLDHILFVLGLFFLTTNIRAVLAQVTAFTVAHSMTLGLTLYGVVSLRASIVEPLIALSIAYVAFENLVTTELKPWRVALVFAFGLLHGMGFADALARLELPRSAFLTTLVGFNAGVEAGQLTIIAAAAAIVWTWGLSPDRYRRLVVVPASSLIGAAGVVWMFQRLPL